VLLTFKINDKEEKNFYQLTLYTFEHPYERPDTTISGPEPDRDTSKTILQDVYYSLRNITLENVSTYTDEGQIFDDRLFNGENYPVDIVFDKYSIHNTDSLLLKVHSLSEAYYNYLKRFELKSNTSGNPFAEPVQMFTNINCGRGIFAGYNTTQKIINIDSLADKK
jgi:hypothetical protein